MPWQDWVFAISGVILGISLIPTIRGDDKPALSTGLITTVLIAIVAVTMTTLDLWLSAATNLLVVAGWGTISFQKFQQIRRKRRSIIDELEEEIVRGVQDEDDLVTPHRT